MDGDEWTDGWMDGLISVCGHFVTLLHRMVRWMDDVMSLYRWLYSHVVITNHIREGMQFASCQVVFGAVYFLAICGWVDVGMWANGLNFCLTGQPPTMHDGSDKIF